MKKKTIEVRAKEGLKVFFPQRIAAAPGARTLVISGDETLTVDGDDRFVARRLEVGDLVMVKRSRNPGRKAKSTPPAEGANEGKE